LDLVDVISVMCTDIMQIAQQSNNKQERSGFASILASAGGAIV
jgi:hypothetical protein